MEVRKVNGFFIIFVIGYIGLSVVCASIMAYAQNSGIAVPCLLYTSDAADD